MPGGRPIYRPLSIDAEHVAQMRRVVREAREVLKRSPPDTFLGRSSADPVPHASDPAHFDRLDE